VTRWQGRITIVVLAALASWAAIDRITSGWRTDCAPRRYSIPGLVSCSWWTTWPSAVRVLLSVLPGIVIATSALIVSPGRIRMPREPDVAGPPPRLWGGVVVVGSLALLGLGFLPWFSKTWSGSPLPGESPTNHSSASAWSASSHWSLGLLLVGGALIGGAVIFLRRQSLPTPGLAVLLTCLVVGVGELSAQWWDLLRPRLPGQPRLVVFTGPGPPDMQIGYIGRDHPLVWISNSVYHSGPTAAALIGSAAAVVMGLGLTWQLFLAGRRSSGE
jgi:hypothetical protein